MNLKNKGLLNPNGTKYSAVTFYSVILNFDSTRS